MTDIDLRDNFLKQHKFISMFLCYPIKTVIRFQQKHGTLLKDSLKLLNKEGGFKRFYSGFFYRYCIPNNSKQFVSKFCFKNSILFYHILRMIIYIQNFCQIKIIDFCFKISLEYYFFYILKLKRQIRNFISIQQYISKSAEFVVLLEALNSWSNLTNNNVNPINLILSFMMGVMVQFTFVPFNSLYYFQQVYGQKDGKELLFYKVKQNGASVFYHGFLSLFLGGWCGSLLAFPALYNQLKRG